MGITERIAVTRQRILAVAAELGRIPTRDEYNARRGDAPHYTQVRLGIAWGAMITQLFGGIARRGMRVSENGFIDAADPAEFERVDTLPPDHLPAKLRWSSDGLMATDCYSGRDGRIYYRLR